ncbi:MAG: aminotransferase class III-fold pyridoxal phosphate-dependent enzyme, partial [Desulfovibrionaceae bacterium]|nr:aminotransferase class III-fold pyridoxal phosphate-dependent enzyme [Desulfovibrionaceae bacterium]
FFCNSGAEANEAAIKLARRYMRKVKGRDAFEIITVSDCFHGRTLAALAATGRESLSDGFTPLPEGFKQVPVRDLAALEAAIGPATAAVMLEAVQGEGGVVPLPFDYLRGVEALCRQKDILLICDEVQAGLGRTGKFWGFQHSGIKPDIISMAKALANGLPMGAILATDEAARGFEAGSHATTFGGGALASGVATKCVEILLRDDLPGRAALLGARLKEQALALQKRLPGRIAEVRGLGLMVGIELAGDGKPVWEELLRRGYICNLSHGRTLRLLPPLTIDEADLTAFVETLEAVLRDQQ